MKRVFDKPWVYGVLRDDDADRYFIEVTCGGCGTYALRVPLTPDEVTAFLDDPHALETLARKISQAPDAYRRRG